MTAVIAPRLAITAILLAVVVFPAVAQSGRTAVTVEEYVADVAAGDLFEIEASRIALGKSKSERLQAFARMMIDDHGKMSVQLRKAAGDVKPPIQVAARLEAEHHEKLDRLRSADGPEFDRLYVEMQTKAHEAALKLHTRYWEEGQETPLRSAAMTAVPLVQGHLNKLRTFNEE